MYRPIFKTRGKGVPILSKGDIEIIGENFIRDYCPDALKNPQPIDVDGFIERYLGLKLDYQYLSSDGRYLGMMVFNTTDKVMIYDPERNIADYLHADARTIIIDNNLLEENQEHRYRYTMAHEGGHDIFHSGYYSYNPDQISMFDKNEEVPLFQCRSISIKQGGSRMWTDIDWMEWQSNFFASVLLMPAHAVKNLLENDLKKHDDIFLPLILISKTAKTFNVSPEAAKYRLEQLKYIEPGLLSSDLSFLNSGIFLSV